MVDSSGFRPYGRVSYGTPAPFGFAPLVPPSSSAPAQNYSPVGEYPELTGLLSNSQYGSAGPAVVKVAQDDSGAYTSPRPGFWPALPDPFDPWRKGAIPNAGKIYNFLRDRLWPSDLWSNEAADHINDQCDHIYYNVDIPTCNAIARARGKRAGVRCRSSATERYSACIAGRPMPPLDSWNN